MDQIKPLQQKPCPKCEDKPCETTQKPKKEKKKTRMVTPSQYDLKLEEMFTQYLTKSR